MILSSQFLRFLILFFSLLRDYSIAFWEIPFLKSVRVSFCCLQLKTLILPSYNWFQSIICRCSFFFFFPACILQASVLLAIPQVIQKRRNEHAENLTTAGKCAKRTLKNLSISSFTLLGGVDVGLWDLPLMLFFSSLIWLYSDSLWHLQSPWGHGLSRLVFPSIQAIQDAQ